LEQRKKEQNQARRYKGQKPVRMIFECFVSVRTNHINTKNNVVEHCPKRGGSSCPCMNPISQPVASATVHVPDGWSSHLVVLASPIPEIGTKRENGGIEGNEEC